MSAPIVELDRVTKQFGRVTAVDALSLQLHPGRTVGVVGESGCGKSTTARLVVGLERPSGGELRFNGSAYGRSARALRTARKAIGMIFQDPYESIDGRFTVEDVVAEPLDIHGVPRGERSSRVRALLDAVGMSGVDASSYPAQFSGGQRQRIGIARALALDPELVICDEPTSALDVSVQAQILNLLLDLQRDRGVGLLVISHDLHVVRRMSDEVAVMYAGMVVEQGPAEAVTRNPRHPYTRALLEAIPGTSPAERRLRDRPRAAEGIASAAAAGCPYSTRCPLVTDVCRAEKPALEGGEHAVACHHADAAA
ncbi:MAG: oligopeptide/dipeptide ABC transporter ATP-binding protein [Gaiellales bacterium]